MSLQSYLSDLAVTALFGFGYYLFKNKGVLSKKDNTKNNSKINQVISEGLSIENFSSLEEYNQVLKESLDKLGEAQHYSINYKYVNRRLKSASYILQAIEKKGISPSIESYNLLVELALAFLEENTVSIIKDEVLEYGSLVHADLSTVMSYLRGLNKRHLTLQLLTQGMEKQEKGELYSKNTYSEESLEKEIVEALQYFASKGLKGLDQNIEVFNQILYTFITPRTNPKAIEYFNKHKSSLPINTETYKALLLSIRELSRSASHRRDSNHSSSYNKKDSRKNSLRESFNATNLHTTDNTHNSNLSNISINNSKKQQALLFKAFDLFEEAASKKLLTEEVFHIVIELCMLLQSQEKLNELKTIIRINYPHYCTPYTYSLLIQAYSSTEDLDTALELFSEFKAEYVTSKDKVGKQESRSINKYLDLLFAKENANQHIDKREEIGKLSEVFSSIVQCFLKVKSSDKAEEVMRECLSIYDRIPENMIVSLLVYYKNSRKFPKAVELFENVVLGNKYILSRNSSASVSTSVLIFNTLLDCCVDNARYEYMQNLFDKMLSKEPQHSGYPEPDVITYFILLRGFSKANDISKVLKHYSYLVSIQEEEEFRIDESLYNNIIDCFARNKDEKNCLRVFEDMKRSQVELSIVSYGIVIKLYVILNDLSKAMKYFKEVSELSHTNTKLVPSIVIYQLVIKCLIKNNRLLEAVELFKDMVEQKGIKPDNLILELLIKNCFEQDRNDHSYDLIVEACKYDVKLENYLYEGAIDSIKAMPNELSLKKKKVLVMLVKAIRSSSIQISRSIAEKFNSLIVTVKESFRLGNSNNNTQDGESKNLHSGPSREKIDKAGQEEELIIFELEDSPEDEDYKELRIEVKNIRPFEPEETVSSNKKKINKKNLLTFYSNNQGNSNQKSSTNKFNPNTATMNNFSINTNSALSSNNLGYQTNTKQNEYYNTNSNANYNTAYYSKLNNPNQQNQCSYANNTKRNSYGPQHSLYRPQQGNDQYNTYNNPKNHDNAQFHKKRKSTFKPNQQKSIYDL